MNIIIFQRKYKTKHLDSHHELFTQAKLTATRFYLLLVYDFPSACDYIAVDPLKLDPSDTDDLYFTGELVADLSVFSGDVAGE